MKGKFEDLPHKHKLDLSKLPAPSQAGGGGDNAQAEDELKRQREPIRKLLRQISESEPIAMQESLANKYLRIGGVVAAYWFVSITLVFVNKSLLSGSYSLDAPLFITWYQCAVTAAACYATLQFFNAGKENAGQLRPEILKKVMPLSFVFVSMITFNNLCLKHVGISFYYISRSLTTVFNVVMTYVILGQKTSVKAICCCAVIIAGFYMGVEEEHGGGSLSVVGTLYGVLASFSVSMYAIFIKRVLPAVDNDVWLLTFYNNVNALILFVPLILIFGEVPAILSYPDLVSFTFFFLMTVGGVFGFAIGYVTGLQVKVTSPLTHNISGTAKAAAQTVIATQWYGEIKTASWWLSNCVVLLGSAAYARVKQAEMAASQARQKEALLPTVKEETKKSNATD